MTIKHLPYEIDETEDIYFHEHYWKERGLKLLVKYLKPERNLTLLDYGCGRGEFLLMAAQSGFSVSGVDADEKCVELARRYGDARQIDPNDYLESFPDNSVDIISSFHVLEHVENPKRLLINMRRVARRYVLIAVPNLRLFHGFRNKGVEPINEGHLQGWDHNTLYNLAVRHCGLELVSFISDVTKIPSVSGRIKKFFGTRAEKNIDVSVFSKIWPSKSLSIIALFKIPS